MFEFRSRIVDVLCGAFHTLVLTEKEVFGWGGNQFGQLTKPFSMKHVHFPMRLPELEDKALKRIFGGPFHYLALSSMKI
jgi:alpha-tubulin suppressor-like RCC1 family protein